MRTFLRLAIVLAASLMMWPANAQEGSRYIRQLGLSTPVIVFVHGVLGDSKSTWTNGYVYWPELLTHDEVFNGTSIYVLEYDSSLLRGGLNINELAKNMRLHFENDEIAKHKEIIFIAHSMGGLITRDYLSTHHDVAEKTKFLYFFSTPTLGSEIATWAALVSSNPLFKNMEPLQSDSYLGDMDRNWNEMHLNTIPTYCAYEKLPVPVFGVIVSQASATHLCNQPLDIITANHITIVKPSGPSSDSYVAFRNAFRKTPSRASELRNDCPPFKLPKRTLETGLVCFSDDNHRLRIRYA
jgi:pimeloyl-ACP methyl ester carboxylesterase